MADAALASPPLRVVMLLDELAPAGGIEESVVTLVEALRPLGVESRVLTCVAAAPDNQYAARLRQAGVPVEALPGWLAAGRSRVDRLARDGAITLLALLFPFTAAAVAGQMLWRSWSFRRSLRAVAGRVQRLLPMERALQQGWTWTVAAWCRRRGVQLIHVHGYGCGAVPAWALLAAGGAQLPVVYSEHGIPWPELRGEAGICGGLAQARRLIAVSQSAARALRDLCGAEAPVEVISHVVPDGPPAPPAPPRPGGPVFGCAAMLRPPKGHVHWLRSMPEVLRRYPDSRFVLAGDGSERAALECEAERLGIRAQMDFLGQVPHADMLGLMAGAWDVFVLPSLAEPLGIVVVEAMAAGLPIVASAAGGVLDLVRDGESALLVPPGDSLALAEAQIRLAGDPALRRRLGEQARQAYVQGPFTPAAIGQATLAVYQGALGAP